jgi:predicted anti-sigma-YlaC factor YlaD
MNCRQAREIMAAKAAGDLRLPEEQELRRHLLDCAGCAGLEDQLERAWDALDCHPTLEPSAEFLPRLRARIQAEQAEARKAWRFAAPLRWRWAALAVCAVVAAVLLTRPGVFHSNAPVSTEGAAITSSRDVSDERLLQDLDRLLEYSAADSLSIYDSWPGAVPESPGQETAKPVPAGKLMKKEPA